MWTKTKPEIHPVTLVLLLGIVCTAAAGRTIYVDDDAPADFNNIQAAIDDSNDGDTIIVAEGTYENVSIDGKSITLRSTDPTNPDVVAATIIDGGRREPAVYFSGAGDYPCWTLSGFTITNAGGGDGSGVRCYASKPTIINNVITNNTADTDGGGILCSSCPGGMIINNLISRNLADDGDAGGILLTYNSSLTIANCTITDNVGYYGNGGIVLMYSSSAVITNSIVWGNNREQIACYLGSNAEVRYSDIEGGYEGIGNIDADPCFANAANGDYHLLGGSPCINAGDPEYEPEPAETDLDGRPRVIGGRIDMGAYEFGSVNWYVDDDAPNDPGPGNPTISDPCENGSMEHPYDAIQEPIDTAQDGGTVIVLDGTYTGSGNRDIDFLGKAITVRSENSPENCIIDCNGTEGEPHRGFYFDSGEDANSVLSGFTIINGHAGYGGGVYCKDSSPTLMDCIFSGNSASSRGGGMYNKYSDPTLTNCTFSGNSTNYGYGSCGGGMFNYHSDPTLTNCTFSGNSSYYGGGMGNYCHSPTITGCMFINNEANNGGGIWNDSGTPRITNCIFFRNSAYGDGGGMFEEDYAHAILTNCIVAENFAGRGAAIYIYDSGPILTNCTISGNYASGKGGGIFNDYSMELAIVTNSILWGNEDDGGKDESAQIHIVRDTPIVDYTCIQGLTGNLGGIGNIRDDPYFVSPQEWEGSSSWIDSDYHLKSQAGRYDPNTQTWVQDDETSPCIDAGDPMSPIGPEPFPNGGIVNIGAYGGTPAASKSYFGRPPCAHIIAGDVNGDCIIDFKDAAITFSHWLEDANP